MEFVSYTDWDQLPVSAGDLFRKHEQDSIFLSRPWFMKLTETAFEHGATLLLACVIEKERVLAILPVMQRVDESWRSLSNRYTSRFTLLISDDNQRAIMQCLAEGLLRLPFRALWLEPVVGGDPAMEELQQVMESTGFTCHRSFKFYNWVHRVQGQSFSKYFSARPAILHNSIKRKRRKLEREHGYHIELFTSGSLHGAMGDYNRIYSASWKAEEPHGEFIEVLVNSLAEQGWTRLAILYIDGQPAAGQIWFVAHGKAYIFRLAYDERWKRYSPGSILTTYLMEHVIDTDHVGEIDYLTGNERYKQDWMSERREFFTLICENTGKSSGRPAGKQAGKQVGKQVGKRVGKLAGKREGKLMQLLQAMWRLIRRLNK